MSNPKDTKEHPELTFGGCRAPTKEESDAFPKAPLEEYLKNPVETTLFGSNPKDTKTTYLNCPLCNYGEFVNKNTYTFVCKCQTNPIVSHFPGCHKIHLECANMKIEEIQSFLESNYWDCYCDGDGYDPQCGEHGDGKRWLESLGEK